VQWLAANIKQNLLGNTPMYASHHYEIFQHSERNTGIVRALYLDLHQLAIGGLAEQIDAKVLDSRKLGRQPASDRCASEPLK
jgi:hypothetical protein